MKCLLSIVITVYNSERCIGYCLDSIIAQNCSEIEVIIVDDGSDDNSVKIINDRINIYSNFRYIYQINRGSGEARNTGIKNANGKYITFIDSDDYVTEDFIANICKSIKTNHEYDMILWGYRILYLVENKFSDVIPSIGGEINGKDYLKYIFDKCGGGAGPVCSKAYNKKFLSDNELSFGHYKTAEDGHFNTQCLQYLQTIKVESYIGYVYVKEDYIHHSKTLFFNRPHFFESSVEVTHDRLILLKNAMLKQDIGNDYTECYQKAVWSSFESINLQNAVYNLNFINKLRVNKKIMENIITDELCNQSMEPYRTLIKWNKSKAFKGIILWYWNLKYKDYTKAALVYVIAGILFPKEKKLGAFIRRIL